MRHGPPVIAISPVLPDHGSHAAQSMSSGTSPDTDVGCIPVISDSFQRSGEFAVMFAAVGGDADE
jgi:hypothetical protein